MEIDQSLNLKQDTLLDSIVLYVATGLFALTIVLATVQVVVRTFNLPIQAQWTEPAARFVLIVATYFGAATASRNGEHIKMGLLLDKLEERHETVRNAFDFISFVVVVLFLLWTLRGTFTSAFNNWNTTLGGVGFVTSGRLYLGISLGLALMLLYEVANFNRDHVRRWRAGARTRAHKKED